MTTLNNDREQGVLKAPGLGNLCSLVSLGSGPGGGACGGKRGATSPPPKKIDRVWCETRVNSPDENANNCPMAYIGFALPQNETRAALSAPGQGNFIRPRI